MDNAWYKEWFNSSYYHLLYKNRSEKEADDFITRLLAYLKPFEGAKMLDVACGKGRHSRVLAEEGFRVTGIDLSENSIEEASKFAGPRLHFYVHDMRLPFWINYFDYVFNFFTSFGYFNTRREHDAAIRSMAQALNDKGVLVMDYLNVRQAEKKLVAAEIEERGKTLFHIKRWQNDTHFFKQISIEEKGRMLPQVHTEKVAKFTLADFTGMLSFRGMQIKQVFGNYQLEPYHPEDSPRLILLAQKDR